MSNEAPLKIAVIGGGAAGFFAALSAKEHHSKAQVSIFEKSNKVLAKVKISGGGRCNVTHACYENAQLAKYYPRGGRQLKRAFEQFNTRDTVNWFEERGVPLRTLNDGCIFPLSDNSQTIIDCFLNEAKRLSIAIQIQAIVKQITKLENGFELLIDDQKHYFDRVIVAIGGQPKITGFNWLEDLGQPIISPVPSLFTFNMPDNPIRELMGNVVEKTTARIEGQKWIGKGPLLITHWGMSGPAILQLSAWGARHLEENGYHFHLLVNWLNESKEYEVRERLIMESRQFSAKKMSNVHTFPFTNRLWEFVLEKTGVPKDFRWAQLEGKILNRLANNLVNDRYEVKGKTTFKEEFVTAGGVDLSGINFQNMESKVIPGLYFAGEVMDVDGLTGGFNFQAAWTTGWIAGKG
jgi:predicted Rossmann fold flavoprotein